MPQTLYLHARAVDVRPLDDCLLAIFNTEETDVRRYYELVRLAISDPAPISANTSGAGRAGVLRIVRTTAQSGGEAVQQAKFDTASVDLPAEVLAVSNPDTVTTTGIALRGIADAPTYGISGNNGMAVRVFGGVQCGYQKANMADIMRMTGGGNTIEPVVLREGEGIAILQIEAGVPHAMALAFVVTNYSTNATYMLRSRGICSDIPPDNPLFGLFNGSGSGVVLGVQIAVLPMDGEALLPPYSTRLAKISGMFEVGETLTPIAADTSNSVPASLNCQIGPAGARLAAGWQQDWQEGISATSIPLAQQQNAGVFTRKTYSKDFSAIGSSINGFNGFSSLDDIEIFRAKAGSGIKIIPGEGIGLLTGRAGVLDFSTFHVYNIEATLLHYPPAAAASAARPQYHLGIV